MDSRASRATSSIVSGAVALAQDDALGGVEDGLPVASRGGAARALATQIGGFHCVEPIEFTSVELNS
ncbi:MAG: hypothetical protein MZV63_64855 [Marinilabiliales bacterium]|nr:hypothetical protein [Marinilabiliales bacterium]